MKLFGNAGNIVMCCCYDGNIYAYDKVTGDDVYQMQGPGKMLLHFDIAKNKVCPTIGLILNENYINFFFSILQIVVSAKDNKSLRVWDIPNEIVAYDPKENEDCTTKRQTDEPQQH